MESRVLAADAALEQTGSFATSASATLPLHLSSGHATIRIGGAHRDRPGIALAENIVELQSAAGESPLTGEALRSNTDHAQTNGFVSARYETSGGPWVSFSSSAYRAARGIAPELRRCTISAGCRSPGERCGCS